jgi:hypothetical protein
MVRGRVLALLGLILLLGLGLRLIGVVNPIDSSYRGADAARYERIAASLYTDQRFVIEGSQSPYDWSPGAPLFYSGVYYLTGGVHPWVARLSIALLGLVTIVLCFELGRRLRGPGTGLLAALLAATYPVFIFNTGRLLTEPLAEVTVPGAALAFLWASDRTSARAWLAPGVLVGLSALVRPEYLAFGAVFAVLALLKAGRDRGVRAGVAAAATLAVAFAIPILPWAIHVSREEGRFVPVSTGGGKALFIGSYEPGDGIHRRVKVKLMERYLGLRDVTPEQRARQEMEPLLDRVAARYPDMDRDAALGRIGRQNLVHFVAHEPLGLAIMMAKKIRYMWRGSSGAMLGLGAVILQNALILFAAVGLVLLAVRRRFEAVVLGALILGVTLFAGVVLAAPRRNLALMPMVMSLAALGLANAALLARTAARGALERARRPGALRPAARLERQSR